MTTEERRNDSPFVLEVGFATDVGKRRKRNEDSYAVYEPHGDEDNPSGLLGLLLVADGMGGERAGDKASRTAAERLRQWVSSGAFKKWDEYSGPKPLESAVVHAIQKVSLEIYGLGEEDPAIRGLGSTVVLVALGPRRATIGHVGDSRCYRVRDGKIERLTVDHSWVEKQVEAGVLSPAEARIHPQRNVLTRSLGDAIAPQADVSSTDLHSGDVFILCSDGMTGGLEDHDIEALAKEHESPQILSERLVALANERDGSDNITAVVGRCTQTQQEVDDDITEELPTVSPPTVPLPVGRESDPEEGSARVMQVFVAAVLLVLGVLLGWGGQRVWASSVLSGLDGGQPEESRARIQRVLSVLLSEDEVEHLIESIQSLGPALAVERAGSEAEAEASDSLSDDPDLDDPDLDDPAETGGDPRGDESDPS